MLAMCSLAGYTSHAALTDLTTTPMGSTTNGGVVKPNILFILDGSGSMNWKFSPDNVDPVTCCNDDGTTSYTCRTDSAGTNACVVGDPPYYADKFNGQAYNPAITYRPGLNYDSSSRGSKSTGWTSLPQDDYDSSKGTIDITAKNPDIGYCTVSGCSAPRRNGIHNAVNGTFAYATPPKPNITAVTFSRAGTTVTGTKTGHNVAVGDVIDVTSAGSCNAQQAQVTAVTATTFSFTWGDAATMAACSSVSGGVVSFSVRGYPESTGVALQPTTAVTKSGTTVTVTYPGHSFILGDQVDLTGGTDVVYSLTTLVKQTSSPKTMVTVTKSGHGFSVGDIIDVTGGSSSSCLGTGVAITSVPSSSTFTFTSTAAAGGSCSGTYTIAKKGTLCNTPGGGTAITGVTSTTFTVTISGTGSCNGSYTASRKPANIRKTVNTTPLYYTLSPVEYCADLHLTDCVASSVPKAVGSKSYDKPAYVRYCTSAALAAQAPPVTLSGTTIQCVDKYYEPNYIYPRYGIFTRGDVVPPTSTTYGNRSTRADCVSAPTCTYTEEMTNYGNWYSYYRRRIQAMKTAAGISFSGLDDRYRVGFIIILPSSTVAKCTSVPCSSSTEYLPIDVFNVTQRNLFYSIFYAQQPSGGTPLRSALSRAGRYFAHKTDKINSGMDDDPVQYSCQQNFALLTTDGMWNGSNDAVKLDGTTFVGNQDNNTADPSGVVSRAAGTYDGGCAAGNVETTGGCSNTLADVAMYYYKTDLRDSSLGNVTGALGQDVSTNNVPTTDADKANWQHMVTFGLALADGLMTWQPDYQTAAGDFKSIADTSGTSKCWWSGAGTCNWPTTESDTPTAIDDLWHAAVNGHGMYFHAGNPLTLTNGLSGALASMSARTAAAAASSTSSPNITQLDNVIYSTTYESVNWNGQMIAQYIDTATGNVLPAVLWEAQATLDGKVGATSDTRTIYTYDSAASNHLKSFDYTLFNATEQAWMDNACSPLSKLSQCVLMSAPQQTWLNSGQNILNFVRGWTQNEGTLLRDRKHALGDTVNATPIYVRSPIYGFADAVSPSYQTYKNSNASRQATIYLAANDGMLHAFDARVGGATGGAELWAYVPRMLLSKLYMLADSNYASKHQFFVDGSPTVMDAYFGGSWHTVLVGGFNDGGRGYYALDVTSPTSPRALWEFCSDSTVCGASNSDSDLGYSYGNPVITKLPDGRWVVLLTSGYNNVSPGDGKGHLYVLDISTGTVLYKTDTNAGSTTTPSGLAKIAAWADNFQQNNTAKYVYGGDLLGNVWRFDLTTVPGAAPSVQQLGSLTDAANRPQSVTTRPELGYINNSRVVFVGTGRYLGMSDMTDPATWTPASTDAYQQSVYAFKDTGTNLGNLRTSGNLVQQTLTIKDSLTRTASNNAVDWSSKNGWYVDFNPGGDSPGERVNVDMLLTLGTLNVKTNVPSGNACVFGGDSWYYQFRYDTGSYVATSPSQIVAQKITGALTVGFVIVGLPGGGLKDITTTATGEKKVFGVNLGGNSGSGKRIGWREISQ
jgi:type IV pilus assembly protein PilY1